MWEAGRKASCRYFTRVSFNVYLPKREGTHFCFTNNALSLKLPFYCITRCFILCFRLPIVCPLYLLMRHADSKSSHLYLHKFCHDLHCLLVITSICLVRRRIICSLKQFIFHALSYFQHLQLAVNRKVKLPTIDIITTSSHPSLSIMSGQI